MAKIIFNGKLVAEEKASLPLFDWGVFYGYGVFESTRAYQSKVFKLDDHLDRLFEGCGKIRLDLGRSREELSLDVQSALSANKLRDAFVRVTATFGKGGPRFTPPEKPEPNVFVLAQPLPDDIDEMQEKGVQISVSAKYIREPLNPLTYVKSNNYLVNALSKLEARDHGVFDVVLLNSTGHVAETSSANLFIYKNSVLETPSIESGILPGITRKTVLEIAGKLEVPAIECELSISDLALADEIFLTNSALELVPVVEFDGEIVSGGKPGELTRKLLKKYQHEVEDEVKGRNK